MAVPVAAGRYDGDAVDAVVVVGGHMPLHDFPNTRLRLLSIFGANIVHANGETPASLLICDGEI